MPVPGFQKINKIIWMDENSISYVSGYDNPPPLFGIALAIKINLVSRNMTLSFYG